jgi:hypothetical protein
VTERRSHRSKAVPLLAVPLLAVAFAACGDEDETAYCVDQNDQVVDNENCDDEAYGGGSGGFFWFYGGSAIGGGRVAPGTRLSGGDKVSASNVAENARRGGFGASGRSSGSSKTGASGVGRAVGSSRSSGG